MTTLRDVAERAGVSAATASRALSSGRVSKKNLAVVRRAARELGYVANPAARQLKQGSRAMTIGVVFNQLNNPLGVEVLDALSAHFEERGYSLVVSSARGQEDRYDGLVERLLDRTVDALFCVNAMGDGAALESYAAASIPIVALFHTSGGYDRLPLICASTVSATAAAIDRLKALGHRNVGVVRPEVRSAPVELFRKAARQAGFGLRDFDVAEGPLDAFTCLESLQEGPDAPTVVVARQGAAVMLMRAADEMHLLVPQDLSLVALRDRSQLPGGARLPISTIHLNPGKVAHVAAQVMMRRLAGEPLDGDIVVEMASWIERATTGQAAWPSVVARAS